MSSASPAATAEPTTEPERKARRSPRLVKVAILIAAVLGVGIAATGCDATLVSKDAIQQYWGKNADCAERIAQRESGLQPDAVNGRSGATGLFQLMPSHGSWIKAELGYDFSEMKDPYKNSEAAKLLSAKAYKANGDGWSPWRFGGAIPGGGCPA